MLKKTLFLFFIGIIILTLYLNQGCKIEIFEPTPTPTPTSTPIPTSTPTPSIPESYISSAKEAIKALQNLKSVTDVGVNYEEYKSRLADTKIATDRFLIDNTTDYIPGIRNEIQKSIDLYIDAGKYWELLLPYSGSIILDEETNTDYFEPILKRHPELKFGGKDPKYIFTSESNLPDFWSLAEKYTKDANNSLEYY